MFVTAGAAVRGHPLRRIVDPRARVMMADPRKSVCVEKLLSWAYRDELPKKELSSSGWDGVADYLSYGGVDVDVDPWESHLRSQRYPFVGKPHEDALTLDWVVRSLDDVTIQWPAAQSIILGDQSPYLTPRAEFIIRKLRVQSAGIVAAHARMGTRPLWDIFYRFSPVFLKNNKPLVQYIDRHGRVSDCHSGQRDYLRGGQSPIVLTLGSRPGERDRLGEPMAEIASARFEYFAWHSALADIVRNINASYPLREFAPQHSPAAQAPWLHNPELKPRILKSISTGDALLTTPAKVS